MNRLSQPISEQQITVLGHQEQGVIVTISTTGEYDIRIVDGAYSPWPADNSTNNQWRTILYVYRNRPIEWGTTSYGLVQPENADYTDLGLWEDNVQWPTVSATACAGKESTTTAELRAGDRLIFVPIILEVAG